MIVACPGCGADVEFRFDDSMVRICGHCQAAVLRTDRGVESLGAVADLMQVSSKLQLFAEGRYQGDGFLLIGMAQIRHASGGVWNEWYARFDNGTWGWLAEAQGRLYLTFATKADLLPAFDELAAGAPRDVDGTRYIVGERGTASYLAARGELPYRLTPGGSFRFADLSSENGGFATLDYGDRADAPTLFSGRQVALADLALTGGEALPQLAPRAPGAKLACPNCGGALELRAPDETLRIGCPYCGHLISVAGGHLEILAELGQVPRPMIPLGTVARFAEGELIVIGYIERSAQLDGTWYPFYEHLLHAPELGFRWLVSSDGHWSYVQPVAPGAVSAELDTVYDGVLFRRFARATLRVDAVLGECYWQVQVGEDVEGTDYVAPPAMLSREVAAGPGGWETTWSLSTYLAPAALRAALPAALAAELTRASPTGVAPNQPRRFPKLGWITLAAGAAVLAVAAVASMQSPAAVRASQRATIPVGPPKVPAAAVVPAADPAPGAAEAPLTAEAPPAAEVPGAVTFSSAPFHLEAGQNVEITATAPVTNNWAYVAVDLVNEATGLVVSFDGDIEYYVGYEDGEAWSEGSHETSATFAPMPEGDYLLRIEGQHGDKVDLDVNVVVRQGVFQVAYLLWALGLLALPLGAAWVIARKDEQRRWQNSTFGGAGG